MLDTCDKQRLHKLLSDTVPMLCKRTLGHSLELTVEAFIGITVSCENDTKEMIMVSFKEMLLADGQVSSYVWSEVPASGAELQIEPVAFSASESNNPYHRPSLALDSIDDKDIIQERHGEYAPNWEDCKYWTSEHDIVAGNSGACDMSYDGDTDDNIVISAVSHPLLCPVKVQQNDETDFFETEADFENVSNVNSTYKSRHTNIVHHSLPAHLHSNLDTYQHHLSASSRLPNSNKGSRNIIHKTRPSKSFSVRHLKSQSKPRAKMMKKTIFPSLHTTTVSSRPSVSKSFSMLGCSNYC